MKIPECHVSRSEEEHAVLHRVLDELDKEAANPSNPAAIPKPGRGRKKNTLEAGENDRAITAFFRHLKKSTSQIVRDYTRRDDISKVALAPKFLKWHWLLVFQIQKKLKTTGLHATTKQNRCTQTNLMFSFSFSFRLALLPLFIFQDFRIISVLCLCGPHFH